MTAGKEAGRPTKMPSKHGGGGLKRRAPEARKTLTLPKHMVVRRRGARVTVRAGLSQSSLAALTGEPRKARASTT
eukprot:8451419-Alexandrium_andersonii.AAC.1